MLTPTHAHLGALHPQHPSQGDAELVRLGGYEKRRTSQLSETNLKLQSAMV